MMTGPLLLAVAWTFCPAAAAFVHKQTSTFSRCSIGRLSSSASLASQVESCVSRLSLLQQLLTKYGAPGSQGCSKANDLVAINDTPELLASLGDNNKAQFSNLHPYLYPIAQSQSTGNVICAYRNPSTEESDKFHPWPIVESKIGGPGMQLLSLNSEHLMRRIVAECDFTETQIDLVDLYNEGLGQGRLKDPALDTPYEAGAVAKLGYGVDKYVLLRVGPFPDLYQNMAYQHYKRGDEQSSLIAAEAANSKMAGFGSTFRFYARLLSSFPNRQEETRDAARMCLRLPLPTIGLDIHDYEEVAELGQITDQPELTIQKLKEMYDLIKQVEEEHPQSVTGKTAVQKAIEEADTLIDEALLAGKDWSSVRSKIAEKFRSVEREDMASFVDLTIK